MSLYQLEGANRYLDWILPALLQEEDLKREADLCGILKTESEEVQQLPIKVRIFDAGEMDFYRRCTATGRSDRKRSA